MFLRTLFTIVTVNFVSDSYGQRANKFFRKDYTYIASVDGFYKIHTVPTTWREAKRVCAQEDAKLWYPDDDYEAYEILSFWNKTKPNIEWVFVGLSDLLVEGVFETVDGKSISEVYSNWLPGEPNNYAGSQDCVYMYLKRGPGYMDDFQCDVRFCFICKKSLQTLEWNYKCDMPYLEYTLNKKNGKCYKLHTSPLSWHDANAMCRLEESTLAVINNQMEAEYLAKLTKSTPEKRVKGRYQRGIYHLGLYKRRNHGWRTVVGTPLQVDSRAWFEEYVPEDDDQEQCGSMFFNGDLISINCNIKSLFICEHEVDKMIVSLFTASVFKDSYDGGGIIEPVNRT